MNATTQEPSESSRGGAWRDVGLLLLLSLVYRLVFLWAMPRVIDTADAIHYLETAQHFLAGDFLGFNPKIPVLYPLLGAAAGLVIPDIEWACRLVSFTASVLLVAPVYWLLRPMHGRRAACIACAVVAVWPWLADYGCRVATEATACLWWFLALALLASAMRHGGWRIWLAPLPFCALYLTRAEGLILWLASVPAAALLLWGQPRRAALCRLSPFILLSFILIAANTGYMRVVTGEATANYRVGFIIQEFDWLRFVQTGYKSLGKVIPIMLGPVLGLFVGIGLLAPRPGGVRRDWALEGFVLVFMGAQWVSSLAVLEAAPRYLMAPLIALAGWSAAGMVCAAQWARPLPWGRVLGALPAAAALAFMLFHTVVTVGSEHLGRRPREPREYKEAGLWMREHLEPARIFTRKPQIAWYAQMDSTGPALDDSLEQALERARKAEARYLVVDERYAHPALRPLLEPAMAPPSLELLYQADAYPQARVVIYALRPPPGTD